MSRGPSHITLEGEFTHDVFGSFSIVRGFATLQSPTDKPATTTFAGLSATRDKRDKRLGLAHAPD